MNRFNLAATLESHKEEEDVVYRVVDDFSDIQEGLEAFSLAYFFLDKMKSSSPEQAMEHYATYRQIANSHSTAQALESITDYHTAVASLEGIKDKFLEKLSRFNLVANKTVGKFTFNGEMKAMAINAVAKHYYDLLRKNTFEGKRQVALGSLSKKVQDGTGTRDVLKIIKAQKENTKHLLEDLPLAATRHETALLGAINKGYRETESHAAKAELNKVPTPAAVVKDVLKRPGGLMGGAYIEPSDGSWDNNLTGGYSPRLRVAKSKWDGIELFIELDAKGVKGLVDILGGIGDAITANESQHKKWVDRFNRSISSIYTVIDGLNKDDDERSSRISMTQMLISNAHRNSLTHVHTTNQSYDSMLTLSKIIEKFLH